MFICVLAFFWDISVYIFYGMTVVLCIKTDRRRDACCLLKSNLNFRHGCFITDLSNPLIVVMCDIKHVKIMVTTH